MAKGRDQWKLHKPRLLTLNCESALLLDSPRAECARSVSNTRHFSIHFSILIDSEIPS
jgi:hypothetical protein